MSTRCSVFNYVSVGIEVSHFLGGPSQKLSESNWVFFENIYLSGEDAGNFGSKTSVNIRHLTLEILT